LPGAETGVRNGACGTRNLVRPNWLTEIVEPLVDIEIPFVPTRLEVCGTDIVIVMLPAFVLPESVMALVPTRTNWAVARPDVPVVFPPVENPPENWVSAIVLGAEMMKELLESPTEIAPAPSKE
jgi:hypothetical protein